VADGPLQGRRIVVTRPHGQAVELAAELEGVGATVLALPLVAIEALSDADLDSLRAALRDIERYDWVVFTSANGVAVARRLGADLGEARIAAVGPATAAAVRELDLEPSFVPERFAGAQIVPGLEPLSGARILLPQADIADPELAEELRNRGATVEAIPAYRTVEVERSAPELAELRAADAVVLTSGSAARSLASRGGAGDAIVLCIGPRTADVAHEVGLPVGLVAREATSEGIIQALVTHFGEMQSG
jgi:uroporphyrinogen-III synthase